MTSNDEYVIQLLRESGYLTQEQIDSAAQSAKAENETTLDALVAAGVYHVAHGRKQPKRHS